jgi:hypothetical protein
MTSETIARRLRHAAVAVATAGMLWAGAASAQPHEMCGPNQVAQIEPKTCPSGVVVKRACCTRTTAKGTKTRCKSFPHCPHRSRS